MSDPSLSLVQGGTEGKPAARVPNIFHFVFGLKPQTEPFHLMHFLCLASCIGVNRPSAVMFHCMHEPWGAYWDRIRPHLRVVPVKPDPFISEFRYSDPEIERLRYAHLADVARLQVIADYGGIYADMDTLFVAPLPASFFDRSFAMGIETAQWSAAAMEAGGALCNAWMMGEPNAPFARQYLRRTYESFDGSWSNHSTILAFRLSREYPAWIELEPARSFFNFGYGSPDIQDIFKRRAGDLEGVYSIHLWSHCWWEPGKMKAAYFHGKRLTPAYVRHAESTYATVARRFLPADIGRQDFMSWKSEQARAAVEDGVWLAQRAARRWSRFLRRPQSS